MDNYPYKHQPFKHQREIFERSWDLDGYALFMEMGTGKTKILADTVGALYLSDKIDGAIVIAKKGEYSNWPVVELPKHMSDDVPWDSFLWTSYKMQVAWGREQYAAFLKEGKLRFLTINVESLAVPAFQKAVALFREACPRFALIIDESTCIKHYDNKRSHAAQTLAQYSGYRRIATGTAVAERPLDLWGQGLVIGTPNNVFGHSNYYSFRGEYATLEPLEVKHWIKKDGRNLQVARKVLTVTGYKNGEKLKEIIKPWSAQMTKDECTDLPAKTYKKVAVPLTEEQSAAYNELRDFAMLRFGDEIMEVTSGLALLTKLHQICCGQLKKEDGSYIFFPTGKVQTTLDLLENHGKKAIIWMGYQESIRQVTEAIAKEYGQESVASYYGPTDQKQRDWIVEHFEKPDHPLKYIVANQRTLGYGRTLLQARLMIYYSNLTALEPRLQSEDRAHRIGQTEKVTYIDLVSPGTVDEKLYQLLKDKKELAEVIIKTSIRDWV